MVDQLDLFTMSACDDFDVRHQKITEKDLQKAHDKKFKQKLLEPEEWQLYRLIRENSLLGKKTTQKEICEKLGLTYNNDPKVHDACPKVWTMITHLNLSGEIEKIIITHEFTYWLGGEKETQVFIDKLWSDLEPRLFRYWAYLRKIKKNGQGKLISAQLKPIDEDSQAREFVESFLGEDYE